MVTSFSIFAYMLRLRIVLRSGTCDGLVSFCFLCELLFCFDALYFQACDGRQLGSLFMLFYYCISTGFVNIVCTSLCTILLDVIQFCCVSSYVSLVAVCLC
jgi:hypothetical protein